MSSQAHAESTEYSGKACVALATNPQAAMERTGKIVLTTELAEEFGYTDVDGSSPASHPPGLRERMGAPPQHWVLDAPLVSKI